MRMRMDLGLKIKKINDLMYKFGNQELKKIDLTFSQFHALVYLEHCENGEATLKQLEAHFKVAQATMAGIISRLECKGYVKGRLAKNDKRVKVAALTPEGKTFCEKAKVGLHRFHHRLEGLYTPEELNQFNDYLDRLYQELLEDQDPAGKNEDE